MAKAARKTPVHFFSFRSPYSWIADRLLRDALSPDELAGIELVPYWEPDAATLTRLQERGGEFLYRPMSREKHLYILQDVKRIAQALELSHVWPIDRDPSWEQPARAYLVARRQGRGNELRQALYRARWELGADIHSQQVLVELAAQVGLDADFPNQLASDAIAVEAVEALLRAWNAGVFGVPFFQIGLAKFWGVDRVGAFVAALRGQPLSFSWSANLLDAALRTDLDADTAGGCG